MALNTCKITANISAPDGKPIDRLVKFAFNSFDVDGDVIVQPHTTVASMSNGVASINLWPNSRGSRSTHYEVYISKNPKTEVSFGDVLLGFMTVPDVSEASLASLMSIPPLSGFGDTFVLSRAQYDALENKDDRALYLIVS